VWFPPGTYVVSKTLVLKPGTTYRGSNPSSSVIRQAAGANLVALMADENFARGHHQTSSDIQIEDLGIDGNSAHNKRGHGLLLMTDRCLVRHVLVSFTSQAGIVFTDQNAHGTVVGNKAEGNRVEDCTIIQPGTYGIWVVDTHASGRQTDGYILNNFVQSPHGEFAMRIERAAGWFIANNRVSYCSHNGIFLGHVSGTYFYCNEVDKFGLTANPPQSYYGVVAQFLMGRFRPSIFMGNMCATPEGLFPRNLYTYYQINGDRYGVSSAVLVANTAHNDPFGLPARQVNAYESTAFAYDVQRGGTLDVAADGNLGDGPLTLQAIPRGANVNISATSATTPLTSAAVAGVAGGAAVVAAAGVGAAAWTLRTRGQDGTPRDPGRLPPGEVTAAAAVTETLSRWEIDPVDLTPDTGIIYLTYFMPYQQIEISQITSATGKAGAARAKLTRVGVYEVLDTGELRLIGATRNRTSRLGTIPDSISIAKLDTKFGSVPLALLAGKPYAYAEIQVGGSPATRVGKTGNAEVMALPPRASAKYAGYQDLPQTLPAPSTVNASGLQFYARMGQFYAQAGQDGW
jgi:hypothetical protein